MYVLNRFSVCKDERLSHHSSPPVSFSLSTQMKLFSATALLLAAIGVNASDTHGDETPRFVRRLQANVGFLVSQVVEDNDWCITASNGVGDFVLLGLQLCDFDNAPVDQLWQVDGEGKFASRLDSDYCMTVNDGVTISDNDAVYTARCDIGSNLNKFFWDAGATDQLRPIADQSFCVTQLGPLPQDTDEIRVKLCTSESRYKWNFEINNPFFMLESFNFGGCIELQDGKAENDNKLILGPCNSNQGWRYDSDGLFHSSVDDSKCINGARMGTIRDGSKLRIYDCDKSEARQVFSFDQTGRISLKNNPNLCVVFRGTTANIDVDPILLKDCNSVENARLNWARVFN